MTTLRSRTGDEVPGDVDRQPAPRGTAARPRCGRRAPAGPRPARRRAAGAASRSPGRARRACGPRGRCGRCARSAGTPRRRRGSDSTSRSRTMSVGAGLGVAHLDGAAPDAAEQVGREHRDADQVRPAVDHDGRRLGQHERRVAGRARATAGCGMTAMTSGTGSPRGLRVESFRADATRPGRQVAARAPRTSPAAAGGRRSRAAPRSRRAPARTGRPPSAGPSPGSSSTRT